MRALIVGCLLALLPGALVGQTVPPDEAWRTFRTEHFRVTHPAGMEELARHAAVVAERTHALLREELSRAPRGMIDVVVTDHADFSNGFAQPFTSNRIVVFARPPLGMPSLAFNRDWLELVVAHELVHIFHLDRAGPVGRAVRSVFGRVPLLWPIFPVLATPVWNIEGIATFYESRLTGGGRVHGSYHDMVIRTAAIEAEIPTLRRVSAPSPIWPGGERSYVYGAALMEWIAEQHGIEAHAALFDATANAILPTFLFFDHVARRPLGRRFSAVYEDWRAVATDSALAVRDRLEAEGVTPAEAVVGRGPLAVAPRVSPDGRLLSYASHDYRSDPATRVLDLATGEDRRIARRNQFGQIMAGASWTPAGDRFVVAQLEFSGPHRVYSDLWSVGLDGAETRLTHGLRLAQPDVAADGRSVAAVQTDRGSIHLVVHDLETRATRTVATAAPGAAFDSPRWDPAGRRLAATRFQDGQVDVVVVDVATGAVRAVTADEALAGSPAWSPDGRWVVFWSDRTGIPNLFAAPADAAPGAGLMQVTNVLTGALHPEVSRDGETLYFAHYHRRGWRIDRIAFDPGSWRAAGPSAMAFQEALLPEPGSPEPAATAAPVSGRYSPLPTLRPYFWGPVVSAVSSASTDQRLRFLGLYSTGWDVVRRHSWTATATADPATGRFAGGLGWTWSGLGATELGASVERGWRVAGGISFPDDDVEAVYRREDRASLETSFLSRRWRQAARLTVSGDVRARRFEAHQLTTADLEALNIRLADLPTLAGVALRPTFSNARFHPYSISPQDGISTSVALGRWWDVSGQRHAYDEVRGFATGYRGYRLWGFSDHVVALRGAGLRRDGDRADATSIGGPPYGTPDLLGGLGMSTTLLSVRGFDQGVRSGTRAWTATGEYRFPLHMPGHPGQVLGLSLTSVSGALFADAGNAWCSPRDRDREPPVPGCPAATPSPVAAAGAELIVSFGVLQGLPIAASLGVAMPIAGPGRGPVLHLGFGPSF